MAEPRAETFARTLGHALELLRAEAPAHLAAVRARMGDRAAVLRVQDAPPIRLHFASGPPWITRGAGDKAGAEVEIAVSARDLDRFARGELTLEEGLADDTLRIRGHVDHVLDLLDALAAWLHGALRCPSFPKLQRDYLAEPRSDVPEAAAPGIHQGAPS